MSLIGRLCAAAALVGMTLATSACGQYLSSPLKVTIIKGQEFAHRVHLPAGFSRLRENAGANRLDHYVFRLGASADVLLIAACSYEPSDVEICSGNAFAVDTARSYAIQEKTEDDWNQARKINGFLEMDDPVHRTLKEELAKPRDLKAIPIGGELEHDGYQYGGKPYLRREKWNTALTFGASYDRSLIVLAGYNRSKLSHGPFTIDVYDSDPAHRIAGLDAESPTWVEGRLRGISIVNSRWFVVALNLNLQDLLLFDFKPAGGPQ